MNNIIYITLDLRKAAPNIVYDVSRQKMSTATYTWTLYIIRNSPTLNSQNTNWQTHFSVSANAHDFLAQPKRRTHHSITKYITRYTMLIRRVLTTKDSLYSCE